MRHVGNDPCMCHLQLLDSLACCGIFIPAHVPWNSMFPCLRCRPLLLLLCCCSVCWLSPCNPSPPCSHWRASLLGALWGFGHSTGQLILGLLMVVLKDRFQQVRCAALRCAVPLCAVLCCVVACRAVLCCAVLVCAVACRCAVGLGKQCAGTPKVLRPGAASWPGSRQTLPLTGCLFALRLPLQLVPALSKWGGAVVGLTLLAIGATGLYETFFEQHEEGEGHDEHDPTAEALTGAGPLCTSCSEGAGCMVGRAGSGTASMLPCGTP